MRIGVLRDHRVKRLAVSHHKGVYAIYADAEFQGDLSVDKSAQIDLASGKLSLTFNGESKGSFSKVELKAKGNNVLAITSKSPIVRGRRYEGDFEISVVGGRMSIVNKVSMEDYLGGVIESEGGGGRHQEYYKVQAIMSRTYALKNKNRHKKEGFQLCDRVHCQAYHNMLKFTPEIREAVRATKGEVLVDHRRKLVTAYFSANCGGQVCDASHVWNQSVPYVETFIDTFCVHTRQAHWTKRIPKTQWTTYLAKYYGVPVNHPEMIELMYNFKQDQRKAFYIHPSLGVPLRDLRRHFKLKSTFFETREEGSYVVLEGRGFGHGVGLCQEGAMHMAKAGYTYKQIAMFYFNDVKVMNVSDL